jgi:riboflavin synthase
VARIGIDCGPVAAGVVLGDSIAVNGVCLTVTAIDGDRLAFDAVHETLEKTALGSSSVGDGVHLERAMRADGRFDGHIVQGHVDCRGTVRALEREGDDVRFFVDCDAEFADLLVDKGSVAIDGVSLTVVSVEPKGFHVALIPHTLERTTLGERAPGSPVNLEADILGKYVKRYLDRVR